MQPKSAVTGKGHARHLTGQDPVPHSAKDFRDQLRQNHQSYSTWPVARNAYVHGELPGRDANGMLMGGVSCARLRLIRRFVSTVILKSRFVLAEGSLRSGSQLQSRVLRASTAAKSRSNFRRRFHVFDVVSMEITTDFAALKNDRVLIAQSSYDAVGFIACCIVVY